MIPALRRGAHHEERRVAGEHGGAGERGDHFAIVLEPDDGEARPGTDLGPGERLPRREISTHIDGDPPPADVFALHNRR